MRAFIAAKRCRRFSALLSKMLLIPSSNISCSRRLSCSPPCWFILLRRSLFSRSNLTASSSCRLRSSSSCFCSCSSISFSSLNRSARCFFFLASSSSRLAAKRSLSSALIASSCSAVSLFLYPSSMPLSISPLCFNFCCASLRSSALAPSDSICSRRALFFSSSKSACCLAILAIALASLSTVEDLMSPAGVTWPATTSPATPVAPPISIVPWPGILICRISPHISFRKTFIMFASSGSRPLNSPASWSCLSASMLRIA
mmetsp:Transcript_8916/g.14461  ORF Transcript_8916/g.14461 Transcript_8916/m.14461 type:complete len:259 (-) Transcript_8916:12319-13095(-)